MNLSALTLAAVLLAGPVVAVADDLDTAYQSLKEAEAKKDPVDVKKLAVEACELARKAAAEPAPANAADKDFWTKHVAYAKEVISYAEYALYVTAIQGPPETLIDLISTLEQQSPKSKYLGQAYAYYFSALNQSGQGAKIPALAEKALPNQPENEDVLLALANAALTRKQPDRALAYANRLTAAMNKHAKPEGMSAADWERRRAAMLGRGYYLAGAITYEKSQWGIADKHLRAALPYLKDDKVMLSLAYFELGVANYQFGKMTNSKERVLEGAKFSEEASKIPGDHQHDAYLNMVKMRNEAGQMR